MLNTICHSRKTDLRHYRSLIELRRMLGASDGGETHAVVVLDPNFGGDLGAVIRRPAAAGVLTIAAIGSMPELTDWGFLDGPRAFGWESIRVASDFAFGTPGGGNSKAPTGRLEVYWPAWRSREEIAFLLFGHDGTRPMDGPSAGRPTSA